MLLYLLVGASLLIGALWGISAYAPSRWVRDVFCSILLWCLLAVAIGIWFVSNIWWAIATPLVSVLVVGNVFVVVARDVIGQNQSDAIRAKTHGADPRQQALASVAEGTARFKLVGEARERLREMDIEPHSLAVLHLLHTIVDDPDCPYADDALRDDLTHAFMIDPRAANDRLCEISIKRNVSPTNDGLDRWARRVIKDYRRQPS
jgi:hypothetical protein